MSGLLPSLGVVQVSMADELLALAPVIDGCPGTANGTTAFEAGLAVPVPNALTAATVNV